eukprot:TRINITY_DN3952_c0_g1_i1.p1 TRINITY_DN3952_c0_g1~~TRINITY_DN3952_c0_g1_i1.p1  ORF type:complete len:177 (+),score=28.73 TRINITY_DN3952_c0_g1_i1:58-588(+)
MADSVPCSKTSSWEVVSSTIRIQNPPQTGKLAFYEMFSPHGAILALSVSADEAVVVFKNKESATNCPVRSILSSLQSGYKRKSVSDSADSHFSEKKRKPFPDRAVPALTAEYILSEQECEETIYGINNCGVRLPAMEQLCAMARNGWLATVDGCPVPKNVYLLVTEDGVRCAGLLC